MKLNILFLFYYLIKNIFNKSLSNVNIYYKLLSINNNKILNTQSPNINLKPFREAFIHINFKAINPSLLFFYS